MLSALLRAAFSVRAFLCADLRRSQCADVALRDGTRAESSWSLGWPTGGTDGPAGGPICQCRRWDGGPPNWMLTSQPIPSEQIVQIFKVWAYTYFRSTLVFKRSQINAKLGEFVEGD